MIDNLTNNPRKREPLHLQWWVPDSKEMLEKNVAYENPFNQETK